MRISARFLKGMAIAIAIGALSLVSSRAEAGFVTYDFESSPLFAFTPLTITTDGLTAGFSTPGAASGGTFGVLQNVGSLASPISGQYLADNGQNASVNIPLDVAFTQGGLPANILEVKFDFVTLDLTKPPATVTVQAIAGSLSFASASVAGSVPTNFVFPQGSLDLGTGATPFDKIEISSTGTSFAIDNLSVLLAPVPEPSAMALTAICLVVGLGFRRRIFGA